MPAARAEGMPGTPTVLVPTTSAHTSQVKPVIAGVTHSGTQVDIYIDNQFNGHATVVEGHHGTAHWSYVPFLNLTHGWHTIQVKAQNSSGGRSVVSQPTYLFVDLLVPSPTLFTPVVNADTVASKPWIVGLATGGMTLDVWMDGELNGSVEVGGSRDEVVSFKYQPFLPLTAGKHSVSVVAHDASGGMSSPAQLSFSVQAATQVTARVSSVASAADGISTEPSVETDTVVETAQNTTEPKPQAEPAEESLEVIPAPDAYGDPAATDPADTEEGQNQDQNRSNTLTTVGWVLLALVAVGMITRGRGKKTEGEQLVKIDTSSSSPHVEVIRKAEPSTPSEPISPTPPTTPTPPNTPTA